LPWENAPFPNINLHVSKKTTKK